MDAEKLREIGHKIAKMEGGGEDGTFIVQMALRFAMFEDALRKVVAWEGPADVDAPASLGGLTLAIRHARRVLERN